MNEYIISVDDLDELTIRGGNLNNCRHQRKVIRLIHAIEYYIVTKEPPQSPGRESALTIRNSLNELIRYLDLNPYRVLTRTTMLAMNDLWKKYVA